MIGIIGASGLIGHNLFKYLKKEKIDVLGTYCTKAKPDLVKFDMTSDSYDFLLKCKKVIICSAISNLDECYLKKDESYNLNVVKTKELIDYLVKKNIMPIFASTDKVFYGDKGNNTEDVIPNPVTVYGQQKVEIEQFIQERTKNYLILRMSKTFSTDKNDEGFYQNIIESFTNNKPIKAAHNEIFNMTNVNYVVRLISVLLKKELTGIFHLTSKKVMSRYEYCLSLADEFGYDKKLVTSVDINSFGFAEKRPLNTSLNSDKIVKIVKELLPGEFDMSEIDPSEFE